MFLSRLVAAADPLLPELNADSEIASAGYYRLAWRLPADNRGDVRQHDIRFVLQESRDAQFREARILYQGPDLATVLSGRGDGLRYYRVRALPNEQSPGAWSGTVQVETRHHSLERALSFFVAGAVVFVLTLVLILRGPRSDASDRGAT